MEGNRLYKCIREYSHDGNILFKKDSFYFFEDKNYVIYSVDEQGDEYWADSEFAEDYFTYASKREVEIWEGKTHTHDVEGLANAKLIAASPDLLEALQELVELKEWRDNHGEDYHYKKSQPTAWSNARDAIKKATS